MGQELKQPTGEDIFNLFPQRTETFNINGFDEDDIDDDVSKNPFSSVPVMAFTRVKDLLATAGFTPITTPLLNDTTEYPFAWNALRYACIWQYLRMGRFQVVPCDDKESAEEAFKRVWGMVDAFLAESLNELGIRSTFYTNYETDVFSFESYSPECDVNTFGDNNHFH